MRKLLLVLAVSSLMGHPTEEGFIGIQEVSVKGCFKRLETCIEALPMARVDAPEGFKQYYFYIRREVNSSSRDLSELYSKKANEALPIYSAMSLIASGLKALINGEEIPGGRLDEVCWSDSTTPADFLSELASLERAISEID